MTGQLIDMRSVSRLFGDTPALRDVTFAVEHGEFVAIVGPSGSGKSTLLNVVGLLDHPTSGTYLLDGIDVSAAGDKARCHLRASKIGFVFQSFHLLDHRSIEENVAVGEVYRSHQRSGRRERALAALDAVGLSHRAGFPARVLSGGERQRVAIARAIVGEPSLLLCDEPTGNLDSTTAGRVLDLLGSLRSENLTIIMITHDQEVAAKSDRVVRILDGRSV